MANLTVSIPHQLTRAEAKRKVEDCLSQLRTQYGSTVTKLEERWTGDTLDFSFTVMGFAINGQAFVEDTAVRVEVALPWPAAMFAGDIKSRIEQEGRKLLGASPKV